MRASKRYVVALFTSVMWAAPAFAHHGWSEYDQSQALTLKGAIRASSYENPHATLVLDSGGRTYSVILAPVSRMQARGATKDSVAVGKVVTVVAYPNRDKPGEVRAERIVIEDGGAEKAVDLR